jgi:uncharacterized membrane protein
MIIRRLFFAGVVLLVFGIWLLAYFCHGDAGFQAGDQISAFSIKLDIATVGYPAIFGVPAVLLGSLLLLVAAITSLVAELRAVFSRKKEPAEKLESA